MANNQNSMEPVILDSRIHGFANQWVALDKNYQMIAHAKRLPELLEILTPEQEAQQPTFMQVPPRGVFSPATAMLTNKVRLCERSEPQSEPFVGRARG